MSLKFVFIWAVSVCLFAAKQCAVAAPPDNQCALPQGLNEVISKKFPAARLVTLADLQDDDKKFFRKDHGARCPGLVRVNFYGDGKPTWALVLTPGEGDPKGKAQLIVAHQTDTRWETRLLDAAGGATPVVWSLGPGAYDDVYGEKTIRAKWPVIVFCGYESWAIVYAWTGKAVDKIWLSD